MWITDASEGGVDAGLRSESGRTYGVRSGHVAREPDGHWSEAAIGPDGVGDGGKIRRLGGDVAVFAYCHPLGFGDVQHRDAAEKFGAILGLDLRIGWQHSIKGRTVVIHTFERINDCAAFEGDLIFRGGNLRVAGDAADGHREIERDFVARFPLAGDGGEAVSDFVGSSRRESTLTTGGFDLSGLTTAATGRIEGNLLAVHAQSPLGGRGVLDLSYSDATAQALSFDTFALRPQTPELTATSFDTTLFRVETTTVPEPTIAALMGTGIMGLITARRNRR